MASLPVNNNLNVLAAIANQTSGVPDNPRDDSGDSFGMIMSRVNSQTDNLHETQTVRISATTKASVNTAVMSTGVATANPVKSAQKSTTESADNTGNNNVKQTDAKAEANDNSDKTVADDKISNDSISDEQKEAVNEAGEKLVEEVAKEMDITPEEVEEAMEVLGLSALQLLDPDNMKQLLITLSGNEDHLSIITDGELYGHLQNLLDELTLTLEDLQTELGLSEEDLNALIADMAVVEAETEVVSETIPDTIPKEIQTHDEPVDQTAKTDEVNPEAVKDYAVTVHKDGETVKVKVTVDNASGDKSVKEEVTEESKIHVETEHNSGAKDSSAQDKGEGNTHDSLVMQTPIEQPEVNETIQEQPIMERYVDAQDIMNQIGEYIKLNLKADVQELELQLHPASLGSVNIQLTAKDGMITAQFTTQNEAVKAAIESQLVQLRTQFDEQGLKVDAVEVAVADYRFNQNFSGNGENAGESADSNKKNRRKINLNELDLEELPEDMEDSDRITAQMMAQNGNTVDFTA
ncbi:MAG: flagellar hook-length control protein FliK [Lachnospiraceae bacterium]|nr:flagellar hook-length control protein FliK [Lachnospiraceae bacterium]